MAMPKPTEDDLAFFHEVVGELPGVETKPMFGNIAGFVNGNMFCGLFGSALGVRLDEAGREELLAADGAGPFGPEDRPMKEYVALPAGWRQSDPDAIDEWLNRALTHTATLPPKAKKKKSGGGAAL